jgi:organic anion transporter 3A
MAAGGSNNGGNSGGTTINSSGGHSHGHRRQESMYAMTGLYSESASNEEDLNDSNATVTTNVSLNTTAGSSTAYCHDAVVKCHSRNPSAGIVDR